MNLPLVITLFMSLIAIFFTGSMASAQIKAVVISTPMENAIDELSIIDGKAILKTKQGRILAITLVNGAINLTLTGIKPKTDTVRPAMLPDGIISYGAGNIRSAWLINPTRRYRHGVIGDAIEAGGVSIESKNGNINSFNLDQNAVFEDRLARLVDMDSDGRDEVLIIKSYLNRGAAIALYKNSAAGVTQAAESEPIGRSNRWLNIVGTADFDGDGRTEIALVITPHIGGTLTLYEFKQGRLVEDKSATGFSNHAIGSRELGWSAILDINGDGVGDIVLPDARRRSLRAVTFAKGRFKELARARLTAKLSTAIVAADLDGDGRKEVIYGLADGSLNVVQFIRQP